jgi:rhodanese-related sulfurtransferase
MSKKKSNTAAGKQATQPSKPAARRAPSIWVLGGLGLLAVIVVAALVVQGASVTSQPAAGAPAASVAGLPAEISVAEAAAKRDAGAFILDVREPDEWNAVHIPGATLIPLGQLVVCRSGNRSRAGRDILTNAGFTNVTSMAGGLNEWAAANLPTMTGP